MITRVYDKVELKIFDTRKEMGQTAANEAGKCLRKLLSEKKEISCVFAAAPSQNEFLESLCAEKGIDWNRINAYHMDEYVGLSPDCKQSFNHYLDEHIFKKVPFKSINRIDGSKEPDEMLKEYSDKLKENKIDVTFMGIGENGHIAFNDPSVADFKDAKTIKIVKLDDKCRIQQVHDKCFATLEEVPEYAFTLTVPQLLSSKYKFCIVPSKAKAQAIKDALEGSISKKCPASSLRASDNSRIYIDMEAGGLIL